MLEKLVPRGSTYAADIDLLFDVITYLVGFWFILVFGFFLYCLFRFRRKAGVKAQYITGETHKQKMAIEVPHYLILGCDVVILIMTFFVWHKVKIDMPTPDEEVRIVAQQWAWSFYHAGQDGILGTEDDIATVNELHIKAGTQYKFHLEATDVMHSFSVPIFRLKQDAIPGRIIYGHFNALDTVIGEWDIQCAEMCGYMHGGMGARLFVETPEQHAEWIAANTPDHLKTASIAATTTQESKEDAKNG